MLLAGKLLPYLWSQTCVSPLWGVLSSRSSLYLCACSVTFSLFSPTESWKSKSCLKWNLSLWKKKRQTWIRLFIKTQLRGEEQRHSVCSLGGQTICKSGRKEKFVEQQGGRLHLHSSSYCAKIYYLLMWPHTHLRGYCGNQTISMVWTRLITAQLSCFYLSQSSTYGVWGGPLMRNETW